MEVMIGEHKARVTDIKAYPKLPPWHKEDILVVRLELDTPVDYLISFAIELAVKDYSRDEFLEDVSRIGEISLAKSIQVMMENREKGELGEEARARLDQLAMNLRKKFEI